MAAKVIFYEKQTFTKPWAWFIVIAMNLLFFYAIFQQVFLGQPFGQHPIDNIPLLISAATALIISVLFLKASLITVITDEGIRVKFFPFHLKFKFFPWNKIERAFIREYNPIGEFGGWGLRFGFFGKGTAYIISGEKGLQLELGNNKKLLIGTQLPAQLEEVLNRQLNKK